jgi:ureidoglycolate lyase
MKESGVDSFNIQVERATPESVAPFGRLLGDAPGVPVFARWEGATVHGPAPIEVGSGGELLLVTLAAKPFPVRCGLIERHFKHTQAYLPANGRPFVMLLGLPTTKDAPDYPNLRAFLFDGSAGIVLHKDVWHDFPSALEDGTRFCVILREEAHLNTNAAPRHAMDADGPDLQRRAMGPRAEIFVHLGD